jgi:S1-C subfamily serine protease
MGVDAMPVRHSCPNCQAVVRITDEWRGKNARCARCLSVFPVPAAGASRPREPVDHAPRRADRKRRARRPWGLLVAGGTVVLALVVAGASYFLYRWWAALASPPKPDPPVVAQGPPQVPKAPQAPDLIEVPTGGRPPARDHRVPWPAKADPNRLPLKLPLLYEASARLPEDTQPAAPPFLAAGGERLSPALLEAVKRCTVYLKVRDGDGAIGTGSGFLIQPGGLIVTNAHVLNYLETGSKPPQEIEIFLNSGQPDEKRIGGSMVGIDRSADLIILKAHSVTPGTTIVPSGLPVGSAAGLSETKPVFIAGFPFGKDIGRTVTVSQSSVSSLRKNPRGELTQIQVNGGMHPGNSGGPVVDARGQVVGIAVAGIRGTQINFAIPAEAVHAMLRGRFSDFFLRQPEWKGQRAETQVRLGLIDPQRRMREVRVDAWAGPPGPPRPGGPKQAERLAGEGPRQTAPLTMAPGTAEGWVPMPDLPDGEAYWFQPSFKDEQGQTVYGEARVYALGPVVRRPPAPLGFTQRLHGKYPVEFRVRGRLRSMPPGDRRTFQVELDGQMVETVTVGQNENDPVHLEFALRKGSGKWAVEGQTPPRRPRAEIAYEGITGMKFLMDLDGAGVYQRTQRVVDEVPADQKAKADTLGRCMFHTLKMAQLPIAPDLRAANGRNFRVFTPTAACIPGPSNIGAMELLVINEGTAERNGRAEAVLSVRGTITPKSPESNYGGKVRGAAVVDLEAQRVTEVRLHLDVEQAIDVDGETILAEGAVEVLLRRGERLP